MTYTKMENALQINDALAALGRLEDDQQLRRIIDTEYLSYVFHDVQIPPMGLY